MLLLSSFCVLRFAIRRVDFALLECERRRRRRRRRRRVLSASSLPPPKAAAQAVSLVTDDVCQRAPM